MSLSRKYTLFSHIDELRKRLFACLGFIGLFSVLSFFFREQLFRFLTAHMHLPLFFNAPQQALVLMLKVSLFSGFILSLPFVFYQVWAFVSCALRPGERRVIWMILPVSLLLFVAGGLFGYFVVFPAALRFLLTFGMPTLSPLISAAEYLSFMLALVVAFGIVFELPLVVVFLSRTGLVSKRTLKEKRVYMILLFFVLAALITPPDVFTQVMMALPMIVLYEAGILLAG